MNDLLLIFTILTALNVVLSTIKSIVTVKGSPLVASITSAIYYAFYCTVLIYTVADFPLWQKVVVTAGCNLVGVFFVKYAEEKARKEKLWEIKLTVPTAHLKEIDIKLDNVPHNYIELSDKHTVFTFYCATKEDTKKVKRIADHYEAKYFVTEGIEI